MKALELGLPREADALGTWLGCTTPKNLRTRMWMIYGGVLIAIGWGCFAMPLIRPPQAGEETTVWALFGILGGSSIVVGLILMLGPFIAAMLTEPQIVHHFEQGIVWQKPSGIVIARWSDITELEMRLRTRRLHLPLNRGDDRGQFVPAENYLHASGKDCLAAISVDLESDDLVNVDVPGS